MPPDGFNGVCGTPRPSAYMIVLGVGDALLGGQAADGFRGVLRHPPTVGVHEPEVVLGVGVTLLGG